MCAVSSVASVNTSANMQGKGRMENPTLQQQMEFRNVPGLSRLNLLRSIAALDYAAQSICGPHLSRPQ
jgi:hypothetical protein